MISRKYVDLSTLTMDGQRMPVVYVNSQFIWKSSAPEFSPLLEKLEQAPQPGFFLTSGKGDFDLKVRWSLNRHGILSSELFKDSSGKLYRDVDAKGIGYTRGHPPRFLGVRIPERDGDMEMRGILHNDISNGDCLMTEEIASLGVRVARYVAQIDLLELVTPEGMIVPRGEMSSSLGVSLDGIRPTIAIRAMGTTSRVYNLHISERTNNQNYVKEIADDAINFVSEEVGSGLSQQDYIMWFANMMGKQLGILHRNTVWTDFMAQIHGGLHNLTLDCRLVDTYHYQSILASRRSYAALKKEVEKDSRLAQLLEKEFPKLTPEQIKINNALGESVDKESHRFVLDSFVGDMCRIYSLNLSHQEVINTFNKAYDRERN